MSDSMDGFWISWLLSCLVLVPLLMSKGLALRRGRRMRRRSFEYYRWLRMINLGRLLLRRPPRIELTAADERRIGTYYRIGSLAFAVWGFICLVVLIS